MGEELDRLEASFFTNPSAPLPCPAPLTIRGAFEQFRRQAEKAICHTGRYRCPYYVWGQGPPLVFIPGLCDDRLAFVLTISLLSRYFRCIAYDLPTGKDDGARLVGYRHVDLVADLLALMDHLGLAQSYLYGSSFGSTVALVAMRQAPRRFPRGVLQGGFARRPLAPAELLLAAFGRWWPWPMARLPGRVPALRYSHYAPFLRRAPEFWDYLLERYGIPPMRAVAHRAYLLHHLDLRPLLPHIQPPVLLICGEHDPLVSKSCEQELLHGLPRVLRVELSGCGHLPQFSHPELLAQAIGQFLSPGATAGQSCLERSADVGVQSVQAKNRETPQRGQTANQKPET